ncbi:PREDICTED: WD repeat-containing protein 76 [Nipponia nippon]|uniref:WD repeat-containing protein 76 n=1 Tax=Nipponia nippon TaxID=128390 RepID=UPI000510ECE4|nr:PREDICTED: WD repeat-containing protein 76 [Nipponia nippon]
MKNPLLLSVGAPKTRQQKQRPVLALAVTAVQAFDGYPQLSAYERKRLKNISENAKFFAALKLHESAARLHQIATKRQSHVTKRAKPKKAEDEPVRRRSMRLQRVEPSGIPVPEMPAQPEYMKANDTEKHTCDMKRYQDSLNSMVLSEDNIKKVVKYRVCSMAIHPSESIIFVAAGDKFGQIGLWNVVSCQRALRLAELFSEEGAHAFTPHNYPVSCMHFSPFNPAHLLSLSNDTLRCGDVTRAVFDEVCRSEENLSSFDFLEDNASTAIVGRWDGNVAVVDRRTPGTSSELSADIGFTRTRTVHVHPVNKQYFIAAGSVDVCIYDVRYLKPKGNQPVSNLKGHTRSVASAYFSPGTGNRVVTVCADDKLRVYDTTSLSSTVAVLSTIRHNNNTGRWLTRFRAIWDPKQEDCFVVGSMARPRQIEVFQDTGKLLHSFYNIDCLGSVCSINVIHPSKNILVGGNSSGRLHVFKESARSRTALDLLPSRSSWRPDGRTSALLPQRSPAVPRWGSLPRRCRSCRQRSDETGFYRWCAGPARHDRDQEEPGVRVSDLPGSSLRWAASASPAAALVLAQQRGAEGFGGPALRPWLRGLPATWGAGRLKATFLLGSELRFTQVQLAEAKGLPNKSDTVTTGYAPRLGHECRAGPRLPTLSLPREHRRFKAQEKRRAAEPAARGEGSRSPGDAAPRGAGSRARPAAGEPGRPPDSVAPRIAA